MADQNEVPKKRRSRIQIDEVWVLCREDGSPYQAFLTEAEANNTRDIIHGLFPESPTSIARVPVWK